MSPAQFILLAVGLGIILGMACALLFPPRRPPAEPDDEPAPLPCVCGQTPTLHHLHGRIGERWLYACAPPCAAALCAGGDTEEEARYAWDAVVLATRHHAQPISQRTMLRDPDTGEWILPEELRARQREREEEAA